MISALRVLCNFSECRRDMRENMIIPIIGVLIFLSCSALSTPNNNRTRRSFGISNPIFSRVFNPYDNRPLSQKFFGHNYAPQPVQYDSPQYYPLWDRQPVLKEVDSDEDNREYYPLNRNFGKPYPPPSHPYPAPVKPSSTLKPYPAATKPYPEPARPTPNKPNVNPCPEPSKPYPGSHKPHQRPAFGRLFVDEVDKSLHFERNPVTGELVPVITEGRRSKERKNEFLADLIDLVIPGTQNRGKFEEVKETERTTTVRAVIEDKTEREYRFKLLPNYDIEAKFNKSNDKKTESDTQDQRVKKLEETKHKIVREFYGSDEAKWPENPFETLLDELKNPKKSNQEPKFIVTSTIRPSLILPTQEVQNTVQEERPRVETFSVSKPTKKPCLNKTTKRPFQLRFPQFVNTERPVKINVRVKVSNVTNPQPFSFRITPHNPRVSEDYTQFLAPPASVIYQKFNSDDPIFSNVEPFTSPSPTEIISHLSKNDQSYTTYTSFQSSRTPPKGLEFRVFNDKLDQSVLDGLKDPETGKLDPSELEKITHTVFVEPLKRKDYNEVRKQLQTLDSRKLNIFNEYVAENKDRYGSFSILESPNRSPSDDHQVSGRKWLSRPKFFDNRRFFSKFDEKSKYLEQDLKPKNIFNVGDIPLDRQEIWDGDRRVLTDSYGKQTSTK